MGDDEHAAPETTPDRDWTPRHRSRRTGRTSRARKESTDQASARAGAAGAAVSTAESADVSSPLDAGTPAKAIADVATPAVVVPDVAAPDVAAPDVVAADLAAPDVAAAGVDASDVIGTSDIVAAKAVADATPGPVVGTASVPTANAVGAPTQLLPMAATAPATDDEHDWLDQDAGPVVRPYTLTGGRSRPFTSGLNLLTHVEALYAPDADLLALQPEHRAILSLTRTALTVAELAARLDLPVGVVRVLVGDLIQANLVSTFEADAAIRAPDDDILQAVIDGLRAL
jgi:hypothetical protein